MTVIPAFKQTLTMSVTRKDLLKKTVPPPPVILNKQQQKQENLRNKNALDQVNMNMAKHFAEMKATQEQTEEKRSRHHRELINVLLNLG